MYIPDCSTVIWGAPRNVASDPRQEAGAPRLVAGAPKLVAGAPWFVAGVPRLVTGASRPVTGALWLVNGAPRLVAGTRRSCQVHPVFSPALRGVPKLITITSLAHLYMSWEILVTQKAGRNVLLGSATLLKLTHLSLHSTSCQTLLEASSD